MRIRVSDVLDLFAAGLTADQILEELPDRAEDLQASLRGGSIIQFWSRDHLGRCAAVSGTCAVAHQRFGIAITDLDG